MRRVFAFCGFVFSIVFFGIVFSHAIYRNVWTDWINVCLIVILAIFFGYNLIHRE